MAATQLLLADDDKITRLKLTRYVEQELGMRVHQAEDGEQAWQIFQGNPEIQFVISDWMMPRVTGLELCARVRNEANRLYTYFILLTSRSEHEDLLTGMATGADDYLTKPFDPLELKLRVQAGLRITSLERALLEQQGQLQEAYGALAQGLEAAERLQERLLPDRDSLVILADQTGVNIEYQYESVQGLGGDVVGVARPEPHIVALYVADISGHGIASSLAGASLSACLQAYVQRTVDPIELAELANSYCCAQLPGDIYATLAYVAIDCQKHTYTGLLAGHPPVYAVQRGGQINQFESSMPPLGLFEDAASEAQSFEGTLLPGERLVCYTDGIIEARNTEHEMFSSKRLTDLLQVVSAQPLPEFVRRVGEAVRQWRGPERALEDDVSLTALELLH